MGIVPCQARKKHTCDPAWLLISQSQFLELLMPSIKLKPSAAQAPLPFRWFIFVILAPTHLVFQPSMSFYWVTQTFSQTPWGNRKMLQETVPEHKGCKIHLRREGLTTWNVVQQYQPTSKQHEKEISVQELSGGGCIEGLVSLHGLKAWLTPLFVICAIWYNTRRCVSYKA